MDFSLIKKKYQDNGFFIIKKAIDSALAKQIVKHVKWLKNKYPNTRPESFHHTC